MPLVNAYRPETAEEPTAPQRQALTADKQSRAAEKGEMASPLPFLPAGLELGGGMEEWATRRSIGRRRRASPAAGRTLMAAVVAVAERVPGTREDRVDLAHLDSQMSMAMLPVPWQMRAAGTEQLVATRIRSMARGAVVMVLMERLAPEETRESPTEATPAVRVSHRTRTEISNRARSSASPEMEN